MSGTSCATPKRERPNCGCYALYKGDTFIDLGTKRYLAEKMGVKPSTIDFYARPVHHKRCKGNNYLIVIRIEDDDENENEEPSAERRGK